MSNLAKVISRVVGGRLVVVMLLTAFGTAAFAEGLVTATTKPDYFAIVDGEKIPQQDFETALAAGMRKKFYHGNVPDDKLAAYREEIGQLLIDRLLLIREAKRRNIAPDILAVAGQVKEYDKRYSKNAGWAEHREEALKGLRAALEEENVLDLLRSSVRSVPKASEAGAKQYYQEHPALFTTPERTRLSTIVLKVAPSSSAEIWAAAEAEANMLVAKLRKGADFAQLARIHSGDETAANGGDMGYLHKGMLAEPAQKVIDKLGQGQVSEPVMLLPGVAIFRLEEKVAPQLNSFESVLNRAQDLVWREQSALAWDHLVQQLRSQAKVERAPGAH